MRGPRHTDPAKPPLRQWPKPYGDGLLDRSRSSPLAAEMMRLGMVSLAREKHVWIGISAAGRRQDGDEVVVSLLCMANLNAGESCLRIILSAPAAHAEADYILEQGVLAQWLRRAG